MSVSRRTRRARIVASDKQLQANTANARKSTGPRSQAGKARSRLNSRKHGLTAKMLIIVGENAEDFDQLRAELLEQHAPESALEIELVDRLAGILWRLRRVPSFEAAILDARHAEVSEEEGEYSSYLASEEDEEEEDDGEDQAREASVQCGRALIRDATWNDALGKLARHETTLMNAFTKTLQMLLLLQGERSGQSWNKSKGVTIEAALPPREH
jgi:hypothetical protein